MKLLACFILISAFFSWEELYAQSEDSIPGNWEINFAAGYSIPEGELSDYANTGLRLGLNTDYYFSKMLGVQLSVFSQSYSGKTKTEYESEPYEPSPGPVISTVTLRTFNNAGNINMYGAVIGPVFKHEFKNFRFSLQLLSGFEVIKYPESIITEEIYHIIDPDMNYVKTTITSEMSSSTIPFVMGFNFSYHLKSGLFFLTDFNYLISSVEVDGTSNISTDYEMSNNNDNSYSESISLLRSAYTFTISMGIGYKF